MSAEEPNVVAALVALCKKYEIKTLVQVGAEDGFEAEEIRKATECRAICVEPDPKCGPVSFDLEWHEVLIGGQNSVEKFYLNNVSGLSSQVFRGDSQEIVVEMPQIRLDAFCRKHEIKPDALIVDTEGTTMDVLVGCGSLLEFMKLIYCEVQLDESRGLRGQAMEVDAYLTERGFKRSMELPTYAAGGQANWTFIR